MCTCVSVCVCVCVWGGGGAGLTSFEKTSFEKKDGLGVPCTGRWTLCASISVCVRVCLCVYVSICTCMCINSLLGLPEGLRVNTKRFACKAIPYSLFNQKGLLARQSLTLCRCLL